jgi:hypothetical protein
MTLCANIVFFSKSRNNKQIQLIKEAFDILDISSEHKLILKHRFTSLLEEYGDRSLRYSFTFHGLRTVITIGSLIVPAILSIQFTATQSSHEVYWIVWFLSLFVTISNALMTLLKVDKKYYTLNTVFHHIVSEGWLYIELTGKYSGFKTPGQTPTHTNQFIYFCHSIEKIRMKQVEDEYFKLSELNNQGNHPNTTEQLIPPTPLKGIQFSPAANINSQELINESEDNTTVLFKTAEQNTPISPKTTIVTFKPT